jgi:hypothetical protein
MGKGGEGSVASATAERKITIDELAKHRTPEDGKFFIYILQSNSKI